MLVLNQLWRECTTMLSKVCKTGCYLQYQFGPALGLVYLEFFVISGDSGSINSSNRGHNLRPVLSLIYILFISCIFFLNFGIGIQTNEGGPGSITWFVTDLLLRNYYDSIKIKIEIEIGIISFFFEFRIIFLGDYGSPNDSMNFLFFLFYLTLPTFFRSLH